jgi:hypothetical protein
VNPASANASIVVANSFTNNKAMYKAIDVLEAQARGASCFDYQHYRDGSADLKDVTSDAELWKHYVYFGQFEGRKARFSCDFDYARILRSLEESA